MSHPVQVETIYTHWKKIVTWPDMLTDLSKKQVLFTAGGALVTEFGNPDSVIWQNMTDTAELNKGFITIAGLPFRLTDLAVMGDFYRYLKGQGYAFHCVDERLDEDGEHDLKAEVHYFCGACDAVGRAIGLDGVENLLLSAVGQKAKQEIYGDMPDHDSLVTLVDLWGADVALGDLRLQLKTDHALPFNASIPLNQVAAFTRERRIDPAGLLATLVAWNVAIPRQIIHGHHNLLHRYADRSLMVVDTRKAGKHELYRSVMGFLEDVMKEVPHGALYLLQN